MFFTQVDENRVILASSSYTPYGTPIDRNGLFSTAFGFTGEQEDNNPNT